MGVLKKDVLIKEKKANKNEGGKVMKKMTKNNKGFSLIELLIVVAILAILAAISINLFGGVLNRQKDKSNEAAASYLQTAIQTYIAETDDSSLSKIGGNVYGDVVDALSQKQSITVDGVDGKYGPYLNNGTPKLSGNDKFFDVQVDEANQIVKVTVSDAIDESQIVIN